MKKILTNIANFIELSFAVRHIRLDQPYREEDLYALREMVEMKK